MKRPTALALACALALSTAVFAQDKAKAPDPKAANPQQERMKDCNKRAEGKTGDDRKKFMSACLSGEPVAMTQQERMTACNKKAGAMKGDERKQFMSSCLKG
jgi:hypothetical protein